MSTNIKTIGSLVLLALIFFGVKNYEQIVTLLSPFSQVALITGSGSGLVAHYTFDEGSGDGALDAVSGNSAVLVGSPTWTSGKVGGALSFDGVDDYVRTSSNPASAYPASFCAWIEPKKTGNGFSSSIINNIGIEFYLVEGDSEKKSLQVYNSSGSLSSPFGSITPNVWQHVCTTIEADSVARLYINGSLVSGPRTLGKMVTSRNMTIGSRALGGAYILFKGAIDDVRVYNRSLSPSDIQELYLIGSPAGSVPQNDQPVSGPVVTTPPIPSQNATTVVPVTSAPVVVVPEIKKVTISSTKAGTGSGTITGGGISCGRTCSVSVPANTTLSLSAVPASGSTFIGWSGGSCSGNGSCSVTASIDTTVTATFGTKSISGLVPASRVVDWQAKVNVGVPGGIPTNRSKCVTTECQNLENASAQYRDGSTDASSLITSAVASAPANTFVYIPEGTWQMTKGIFIGKDKDSITVRGAGVDKTILDCRTTGSTGCVSVSDSSDWQWRSPATGNTVSSGLTKGSTTVRIPDTSSFFVGQLVRISVENDPYVPVISVAGFQNLRRQFSRVTAKTSDSLSLFPAVYLDANGFGAKIHGAQNQVDFVGVEDLTIDGTKGSHTFSVIFEQTYGSWLKNVKVVGAKNYGVFVNTSLQFEMRHSYIGPVKNSGTNGAGLLVNTASGSLFEDNIILDSFPNIEVNHGASGNVFAYNFIKKKNGQISIDSNHGPHNQFNLYEGNVSTNLMSDGYFGSESDTTLFRNWFHGNSMIETDTRAYCLSLKRFSRNFSVIGNMFGGPRHTTTSRCDYYHGQPNIGNPFSEGTAQLSKGDSWVDWSPNSGTTIRGVLVERTDDQHGVLKIVSGTLHADQIITVASSTILVRKFANGLATIDSSPWGSAAKIPPLSNTEYKIEPGAGGFQELDLDVEATTIKKGNWNSFDGTIPASESLSADMLPDSLYLSVKPAWFGDLSWPAITPHNPKLDLTIIPAGYRYIHNKEVPGAIQ